MESRKQRVHRWATMVAIGAFSLSTGASYLVPSTPTRLAQLEALSWVPLPALGVLWVVIGVLCLLAVPVRRIQPWALGAAAGLTIAWAVSFATSVLLTDITRSWVSAKNYGTIAALIALHAAAPARSGAIREIKVYGDVGEPSDRDHAR